MKLIVDKNVIEFSPESDGETTQLLSMWNMLVDCVKFNKKIVPIGEYVPEKANTARFVIEGEVDTDAPVYAPADITVYCQTCNKYFNVKKGDQIPLCCGRVMESLD